MDIYITNRHNKELPLLAGITVFFIFFIYNLTAQLFLFVLGLTALFVCVFIFSFEQLFLLCILLLPNLGIIKVIGNDTAWFGYFMLLVGLKYILCEKIFIFPWLLLHAVSCLLTICLYVEFSLFTTLVRNIVFFVFVFSIFKRGKAFQTLEYQKSILVYYLIGLSLYVCFGLLFWAISAKEIFNGAFSGIAGGRNYFASIIAHGIGLFLLFLFQDNEKYFILKFAMLMILLFAGFLSASRTFLLSLIFIVLEFLVLIIKPKNIIKGFCMIFFALVVLLVFWDYFVPAIRKVINRFTQENAVGGNGRFALWKAYLELTFSRLERAFLGNGLAINYQDVIRVEGYPFQVEHNTFIQAISTVGLCGTITLFMIYVGMYKIIVPNKKKFDIAVWMPLCAGLLFYMSISSLYSDRFNGLILVSFIAINYFSETKNKSKLSPLPLSKRKEL